LSSSRLLANEEESIYDISAPISYRQLAILSGQRFDVTAGLMHLHSNRFSHRVGHYPNSKARK
jgi:hypothetical protein